MFIRTKAVTVKRGLKQNWARKIFSLRENLQPNDGNLTGSKEREWRGSRIGKEHI